MNHVLSPLTTDRTDMTHEVMPVRTLPAHGLSRNPIHSPPKELLCTSDVSYMWAREETMRRFTRSSPFYMDTGEHVI
jgi:hypothetical protein